MTTSKVRRKPDSNQPVGLVRFRRRPHTVSIRRQTGPKFRIKSYHDTTLQGRFDKAIS